MPVAVQPEDGVAEAVDDDHPGDSIVATVITTETPASPIDRFWATRVGAISFFAVAGLLYGFLDPTFGLSLDSLLLYLGILAALAVGTLASTAAIRWARESLNGERGTFRVLPATLLVALVCVLVTRITDFQPGYLYGVLAGLAFGAVIGERAAGRESAIAISAVAGLGLAAFLALGVVRALEGSGGPTGLWVPLDVALSALVIGGFEGLLFGLVPLSGLPGATVKAWNSRIWALLLFLGALGFLHVIVNPAGLPGRLVPDAAVQGTGPAGRLWGDLGRALGVVPLPADGPATRAPGWRGDLGSRRHTAGGVTAVTRADGSYVRQRRRDEPSQSSGSWAPGSMKK